MCPVQITRQSRIPAGFECLACQSRLESYQQPTTLKLGVTPVCDCTQEECWHMHTARYAAGSKSLWVKAQARRSQALLSPWTMLRWAPSRAHTFDQSWARKLMGTAMYTLASSVPRVIQTRQRNKQPWPGAGAVHMEPQTVTTCTSCSTS